MPWFQRIWDFIFFLGSKVAVRLLQWSFFFLSVSFFYNFYLFILALTQDVFDHLASYRQVNRRFHSSESNRQPPHSVWIPLHYCPVV